MKTSISLKRIVHIVGTRPNFIKVAPLFAELEKHNSEFENILIHTGQHYDINLSDIFFNDLKLSKDIINLEVGSGTHAEQTGQIMIKLERQFVKLKPDLIIVYGDVNSTVSAALVASKLNIKLAHVEAGLRSFDNEMPEEINRIVTDRLSDYLFVSEPAGVDNLKNEGLSQEKIFLVGNIMIDSLIANLKLANQSSIHKKLSLPLENYVLLTLHRPINVDSKESLNRIFESITKISERYTVIFPCHPRTMKSIKEHKLFDNFKNNKIKIISPVGYHDFLKLIMNSNFVITDSGGIQADTTYLKIPCITLRETTEQLITIIQGTNILCWDLNGKFFQIIDDIIEGNYPEGTIPEFWDGETSKRIVSILIKQLL
ncbi:MAG: UDP-N-acetylglucosamine 2-epimerase (non-hydrolyzing) [candidate division Zixibacteria bacterium]|nr:UDP-N-acetylglucosamine 2-epimerase (non-hydrolyzing) [candidate division Zixibacteria bacterium]